jgi:hypothetical protein
MNYEVRRIPTSSIIANYEELCNHEISRYFDADKRSLSFNASASSIVVFINALTRSGVREIHKIRL